MYYQHPPMHNLNEPNQLVVRQFNTDSFTMVQQVYFHLGILKQLSEKMPIVDTVGSNMYKLDGIQKYLGDIVRVAESLNTIINLQSNLPVIQDVAPRFQEFKSLLEDIDCKISRQEVAFEEAMATINTNVKLLEDMYIQYECGLTKLIEEYKANLCADYTMYKNQLEEYVTEVACMHTEYSQGVRVLEVAVNNQNELNPIIAHLKASDSVTLALVTGSEEDYAQALNQIKESEKWGNDEKVNRTRLNYKLETHKVKLIKTDNEARTREGIKDECSACTW